MNIPEFNALVPKLEDPAPLDKPAVFGLNTGASTLKTLKSVDDGATVWVIKRGKAGAYPTNYADEFVDSA